VATDEARRIRDEELLRLRSLPVEELARRYNGRTERKLVGKRGGYEVVVAGSDDYRDDPTSDFYLWIYVRPARVGRMPVIRWLISARGTMVLERD
jgi:hypothetical protein